MSEIVFDEDTTLHKPLPPEVKVPETGFEGWFYKHFPGNYFFKKGLLFVIAILLFAVALFFLGMGQFNLKMQDLKFQDRVTNPNIQES